jgi:DNA-binding GntR family transcriptional regulator
MQLHMTKMDIAVHALRERILSGQLQPGERLRVETLTEELGMSPTPIREALRVLQADRLVEYSPHHKIFVAELSLAQVAEIYQLRAELESFATELAVPRLRSEELDELETTHAQWTRAAESGRGGKLADANIRWHWMIYHAAGSTRLDEFIRRLWEAFPWRTQYELPGLRESSIPEHEGVMVAIRAGDSSLARARMHAHISSGQQSLLAALRRRDGAATVSDVDGRGSTEPALGA